MRKFLDAKRETFPRLYFLSNDDIIEMYQENKLKLSYCFENIQELEKDENGNITHVISREGLKMQLSKPINPKNKEI